MRQYVRDNISPTKEERDFVSEIYESIQDILGEENCLQIGSYSRFTAITPLHDLDILYVLGEWDSSVDPSDALNKLQSKLKLEYKNPTSYSIEISRQTHSVTIVFSDNNEVIFSVDIVPAYISGVNNFGSDMYVVPEIAIKSHSGRKHIAEEISRGEHKMTWIKSDPRGYVSVATRVNTMNDDFRKSVKLVKGWRISCKNIDDDFPLKSFHLEQVITRDFQRNSNIEIFDAVSNFFYNLPRLVEKAQIPDRADSSKKIDAYVENLNEKEKRLITEECNLFLTRLEKFKNNGDIIGLFKINFSTKKDKKDFLDFTKKQNVLSLADYSHKQELAEKNITDHGSYPCSVEITAQLFFKGPRDRKINRRSKGFVNSNSLIPIWHEIDYIAKINAPKPYDIYWQVVNTGEHARHERDLRGRIFAGNNIRTEHTRYHGVHWIECFIVSKQGVCIARSGPFYTMFSNPGFLRLPPS